MSDQNEPLLNNFLDNINGNLTDDITDHITDHITGHQTGHLNDYYVIHIDEIVDVFPKIEALKTIFCEDITWIIMSFDEGGALVKAGIEQYNNIGDKEKLIDDMKHIQKNSKYKYWFIENGEFDADEQTAILCLGKYKTDPNCRKKINNICKEAKLDNFLQICYNIDESLEEVIKNLENQLHEPFNFRKKNKFQSVCNKLISLCRCCCFYRHVSR